MTFGKQLIALGGIVFFCGALLPTGEALAFGQQWRPAPGFGAARIGSHDRVANTPSFRPHSAARPTIQRSFNRVQQRPYRQHSYQPWPHQPPFYAAQRYPAYRGGAAPVGGGFYPQLPHAQAVGYRAPGWSAPFAGMMQPWGLQMPMFTRQFAWRPADQPWRTRNVMPRYAQPQYRVRAAVPQQVGFRTGNPAYVPVAGSWRPAVRPQYAYQRYGSRPQVMATGLQPGFRAAHSRNYSVPGARRIAGADPVPLQTGWVGHWRPQAGMPAAAWHTKRSFRPQAYGRSVAEKVDVASRRERSDFTRDNLPGWVTTYQDSGHEDACSWCSGS